jgi:hypothetical protein
MLLLEGFVSKLAASMRDVPSGVIGTPRNWR